MPKSTLKDLLSFGQPTTSKEIMQPSQAIKSEGSFRRGGKVKKTGHYKLHKGERVITARKAERDKHNPWSK